MRSLDIRFFYNKIFGTFNTIFQKLKLRLQNLWKKFQDFKSVHPLDMRFWGRLQLGFRTWALGIQLKKFVINTSGFKIYPSSFQNQNFEEVQGSSFQTFKNTLVSLPDTIAVIVSSRPIYNKTVKKHHPRPTLNCKLYSCLVIWLNLQTKKLQWT